MGAEASKNDQSTLETKKLGINKELFPYFPPELAESVGMMPISFTIRKGKDAPLREQEWTLSVAVREENAKEVTRNADYYAEQIRDASRGFWPPVLTLNIVTTTQTEVDKRLSQIRTAWRMRMLDEAPLLPPVPANLPDPIDLRRKEMDDAERQLMNSFTEVTSSMIAFAPGSASSSDQVIDLRVEDRAGTRRALQWALKVAIMKGASDIHFEYVTDGTQSTSVAIRLRVDGLLRPLVDVPNSLGPAILNILGKCAGSGVEESSFHMRPQDGKVIIYAPDGRRYDGRLAFVPVPVASGTFNCVLRLLDSTRAFEFDKLELAPRNKESLEWALGLDHGMVVLTGPTGSGKSSTIQACLRKVIAPELKVITIEDPVEYFLPGAEQTQVNHKDADMSFGALLRSALRRDPDVIFVGEMRDEETAAIAVKAALTGHLVFSTVHANTALEVVDRLVNLGVHRELVASALAVVGGQRLLRRIDPDRWNLGEVPLREVDRQLGLTGARDEAERDRRVRAPILKPEFDPGDLENYSGRIAVHQFHRIDDEMKDAIRGGKSSRELALIARKAGMKSLSEDALQKVQKGQTSLEEIALNLRGV